MLTFDVITIFPELIRAFSRESLLKRAQEKKLLKIGIHNLRDWANDKVALRQAQGNSSARRRIDDKPYGGGLGMVLKVEPIYKAISTLKLKVKSEKLKVILFTPRGKKFTQEMANKFSKLDQLIFICGRYEGVDERVAKHLADEELSIGDYVLMGGEIPAMAVIETVARLVPGVVGKPAFLKERFLGALRGQKQGFLEYPQYTRPEVFSPSQKTKWKVPQVLLSGDHKKIGEWKKKHGRVICK